MQIRKRLAVQAAALLGLSLPFIGRRPPADAAPPPYCKPEQMCGLQKPIVLIVLDGSTSMNKDLLGQGTRWDNAVSAIKGMIAADNGYLVSHAILGLARFGHDPDPGAPGTPIPGDLSGLVDGVRLDVPVYDPDAPGKPYRECGQGDAITLALDAMPAPLNGALDGIESWTRGGLELAQAHLAAADADHPQDLGKRAAAILLITDGPWTGPTGTPLTPADQDPALTAGDLWTYAGVPTHVVALGEAVDAPFADQLAAAGGTGKPADAVDPQGLIDALALVVDAVDAAFVRPPCAPDRPRVLLLIDASSSMLNLDGDGQRAPMGQGGWEQTRESLAADLGSIFDQMIESGKIQDLAEFGLAVFGDDGPAEEALLVQYGSCVRDNIRWALDPASSCAAPGCVDPYAGPPIAWTFQDGALLDPPSFDVSTLSHVPRCDGPGPACAGSGSYTHRGLMLAQQNLATVQASCLAPDADVPCDNDTEFVNILITDGRHDSTDAQVQAPLQAMHADGVVTHVVGFAPDILAPATAAELETMADWGSGGVLDASLATSQVLLEMALADILESLSFNPCCAFTCESSGGMDSWVEPDPVPPDTDWSSSTATDDTATTVALDTGAGTSTGEAPPSTTSTTTSTAAATTDAAGTTSTAPPTTGDPPATPTTGAPPSDASSTSDDPTAGDVPADGANSCACSQSPRPARDLAAPLLVLLAATRRLTRRTGTRGRGSAID